MLLKQLTEEMHMSVSLKLMHWNGMECVCVLHITSLKSELTVE